MDWIMSGGGPLICLEERVAESWGGGDRLTVGSTGAKTDYDRACQLRDYVNVLPLEVGCALILGDMPLNTSIVMTQFGAPMIVRTFYADHNINADEIISKIDYSIFSNPLEALNFSFHSTRILLFDSVESGRDRDKPNIKFALKPGSYNIMTQTLEPDAKTSLLPHWFDHV